MMNINYANEIKERVSMKEVCYTYGISINRQSKAICPFHNDKHASMHIYEGDKGYWCFTCGEGGSVIDFVMRLYNLSFTAACKKLNADFNLGLPIGKQLTLAEMREAEKVQSERRKKIEEKKKAHKILIDNYIKALYVYTFYDRMLILHSPFLISGIDDIYARVIKEIAIAEYNLDVAETRLYEYEHFGN